MSASVSNSVSNASPEVEYPCVDECDLHNHARWANSHSLKTQLAPETIELLRVEDQWIMAGVWPPDPAPEEILAIGSGEKACPLCHDSQSVWSPFRGETTGAYVNSPTDCVCRWYKQFHHLWSDPENVPERFRSAWLPTLTPSAESNLPVKQQAAYIRAIQDAPDDSWLMIGAPGAGKTHLLTSLYLNAAVDRCREVWHRGEAMSGLWRVRATTLMDDLIAWNTREPGEVMPPAVTVKKIRLAAQHDFRPKLYIDEIDKLSAGSFRWGDFFGQLIDEIYSQNGQVVATSNLTLAQLSKKWPECEAEAIFRRIGEGSGHTLLFR